MHEYQHIDPEELDPWRKAKLSPRWIRLRRADDLSTLKIQIPLPVQFARRVPFLLAHGAIYLFLLLGYLWVRSGSTTFFPQSTAGRFIFFLSVVSILVALWLLNRYANRLFPRGIPWTVPLTVQDTGDIYIGSVVPSHFPAESLLAVEIATVPDTADLAVLRLVYAPDPPRTEPFTLVLAAGSRAFIDAFANAFGHTPHTISHTTVPLVNEIERSSERATDQSNPNLPLDATSERYWYKKAHWIRPLTLTSEQGDAQLDVTLPSAKQTITVAALTIGVVGAIAAAVIAQGNRGGSYLIDLRFLIIPGAIILAGIIAHRILQIALRSTRRPLLTLKPNGAASLGWRRKQDFEPHQVIALQLATGRGIYKDPDEFVVSTGGQTIEQLRIIVKDPTTPTGIAAIPIVTAPSLGYDRLQAHFAKVGIDLQRRDVPQPTRNDPHHR